MSVRYILALAAVTVPAIASAAWQIVATEQGKRVEIDRDSIVTVPGKATTARGRVVLDKPIVDPKTGAAYRIIEVENRFDCSERTHATLKRSYFKDEGELLRMEEVKSPFDMPVRSGTPDDRFLREACRPKSAGASVAEASKTVEKINEASGELRKMNEALVAREVGKGLKKEAARPAPARPPATPRSEAPERPEAAALSTRRPAAAPGASASWSYDGAGGPDNWSKLSPENAVCATGRYQSPIDIRDGFAVDLEPIRFNYRPAAFRVVDGGRHLQMAVYGGGFELLGKNYELNRLFFHRPSEIVVEGKTFDMDVQLFHKAADGKQAIVTILLESGKENPVVQKALNNLPLEKGGEVAPPGLEIDVGELLPANRGYFAFMGSLTTPPCTEDVLWLVLKQTGQISAGQISIFERLYRPNARPVQPDFGRIIKESR